MKAVRQTGLRQRDRNEGSETDRPEAKRQK